MFTKRMPVRKCFTLGTFAGIVTICSMVAFTLNTDWKFARPARPSGVLNQQIPVHSAPPTVPSQAGQLKTDTNQSGMEWSRLDDKSQEKYLIYLCDKRRSCGGWADRQRGMMSTYVLALVTGRTFGINMSYPCDLKLFYVPNQVNWYIKVSDIRNRTWEVVDWMGGSRTSIDLTSDFNAKHPSDIVFIRTNDNLNNKIAKSPRYSKLVPEELRNQKRAFVIAWHRLMKLSIHMEEHLDRFMSVIPKAGSLVCAHIRMRKSPTIPNDSPALSSFENLEAMWKHLARYQQKASRIFIASDSMEARTLARKRFKEKELDSDGLVLHIDRQGKWGDACKGFEMALLEQAVLAKCDILILSPSGFGSRAAQMSTIKQELFLYRNGTVRPFVQNNENV